MIHANRAELPLHQVARARLTTLAEGAAPWALPVLVPWGFVRIVTQSLLDPPTPVGQAVEFVDRLLASPTVRVLAPGSRHWQLLSETVREARVRGGMITDAVLVALCREHGVDKVLSNDRDFNRFPWVALELLDPDPVP